MGRFIAAMLCFSTLPIGFATQRRYDDDIDVWCGDAVKRAFRKNSTVFLANPGGVLDFNKAVSLRDMNGSQCVCRHDESKGSTFMVIDEEFESVAECCDDAERSGMGTDDDGNLLPFSEAAFANMGGSTLAGVDYKQIQPDKCPAGGCPLVVELPGHGGEAWLMVRYSCVLCRSQLGVVIISPTVGEEDDTGLGWVASTFIPWVRAYLADYASLVDKSRVYLVTASRGNEIGLTAALAFPDIWSNVIMSGKFKFTPDVWDLLQNPAIFSKAKAAGLQKLDFNIGDMDMIIPHAEFFSNFSVLLDRASSVRDGPNVILYIYPGFEHDTGPGVWSQRSKAIWEGSEAP